MWNMKWLHISEDHKILRHLFKHLGVNESLSMDLTDQILKMKKLSSNGHASIHTSVMIQRTEFASSASRGEVNVCVVYGEDTIFEFSSRVGNSSVTKLMFNSPATRPGWFIEAMSMMCPNVLRLESINERHGLKSPFVFPNDIQ